MKIWFDTEFIEDGRTIDLISIGMVSEDGREYYAEVAECDHSRADPWVKENVLVHLTGQIRFREEIRWEVLEFCGPSPEFWAYYCSYDWGALCQLFGRMVDLPDGWPMLAYDFRQWLDMNNLKHVKSPDDAPHNSLMDAKWLAGTFKEHGPK